MTLEKAIRMNHGLFRVLFLFFLVITPTLSQISLGTLGGGLNTGYLQNGGLIYPNADGSGPQASSLAAAIYGVAVPPGFNQFSASENFFGENKGDLFSNSFGANGISDGIKPSDLFLGTGTDTGGNGGDRRGSYSTYISDFSVFGDFGYLSNNDQKSSSSSLVEIDPIAARFGVVIPNVDQTPLHPSLSGSTESFSGSTGTGVGDGTKDLFTISPVETSIKFDLPSQAFLSGSVQSSPQFSTNINNYSLAFGGQNGLSKTDESFSVDTGLHSPSSDNGKNQADIITTAFKFSDDQIIKTEEIKRNFEHATASHIASGKFTASTSTNEFDELKNLENETENVGPEIIKEKIDQPKTTAPSKQKESTKTSNEFIVSQIKSTSPYAYRGNQRGQQQAQQSERDVIITEAPEDIPEFQYLRAPENGGESYTVRPKKTIAQHHNSHGFLTSPGYRTYHK